MKIPRQPGSCVFSRGDRKTYAIGRSPGPRAVCGTGGAGTAATRGTELGETLMADSVAMLCLLCGWCLLVSGNMVEGSWLNNIQIIRYIHTDHD